WLGRSASTLMPQPTESHETELTPARPRAFSTPAGAPSAAATPSSARAAGLPWSAFLRNWLADGLANWSNPQKAAIVGALTVGGMILAHAVAPALVPFVLVMGPCTYDYWCIHEKIRNPAATEE